MFISVCSLLMMTWWISLPAQPPQHLSERPSRAKGDKETAASHGPGWSLLDRAGQCLCVPAPGWGKATSRASSTPLPLTWPQALSLGLHCRPLFWASPSSQGMDLRSRLSSLGLITKGPSSGFLPAFSFPVWFPCSALLWLRFLCVLHQTGNIQTG